jgi:hypothetical protein
MREILPDKLWLGNAADVWNLEGILGAGILAVVDLALEELTPTLPRSTIYCRFPIVLGGTPEERLRQVVSGHPHDVSPSLWNAVREACEEIARRR